MVPEFVKFELGVVEVGESKSLISRVSESLFCRECRGSSIEPADDLSTPVKPV